MLNLVLIMGLIWLIADAIWGEHKLEGYITKLLYGTPA